MFNTPLYQTVRYDEGISGEVSIECRRCHDTQKTTEPSMKNVLVIQDMHGHPLYYSSLLRSRMRSCIDAWSVQSLNERWNAKIPSVLNLCGYMHRRSNLINILSIQSLASLILVANLSWRRFEPVTLLSRVQEANELGSCSESINNNSQSLCRFEFGKVEVMR